MPQIAAWYDNLIANNPGNGNPPAQNNPITNGLIVFKIGQRIQHSMIVMQPHTWVGANNIGSLGNAGAVPVDDTGVMLYNNMNQRNFVHAVRGGWNANGNIMRAVFGDNYTLHYIPFF